MAFRRWLRFVVQASILAFVPGSASAQSSDLISVIGATYLESVDKLFNEIANKELFDLIPPPGPFEAAGVINSATVLETAAFPIGSSSGGFTYFYDATSGAAMRSSPSFGPAFAERPLTSGRGTFNVGITYLHRRFSELEGVDVDDGSLKFHGTLDRFLSEVPIDVVESTFKLKMKSDTTTLFATYGVLDKLDVSLAVPIQHVSIDAEVTSQLLRFGPNSGITGSQIPAGTASRSQSASGIGDIAVRAKYNFLNNSRAAMAGGLDVRLPTGDENDLLGTGKTRTMLYAAVTAKTPRLFPHANFGYTFKAGSTSDQFFFGAEIRYAVGAEYVVTRRLTAIGDIIGRSLADEGRMQAGTQTFNLGPAGPLPAQTRTVNELIFEPGLRLNSTLAVAGAKFNPASTFIVSGHMLFPLTKGGLRSVPTAVIGIDYSF